ncbi:DUF4040 domain-containing protein [Allosaccharopolyspora coralli]|uniref:DUF4040 domain-containing protein n=1 Tax=Allosaccharopolyspora coralli TaxID=2665642 RepID=A0A5Q3QCX0_9PSEU|nr:DUF4040 domain-containing protein [Allosaccharopolyspora coralli]
MLALVALHLLGAILLPTVAVRNTRAAFLVAAVLPAVGFGWIVMRLPAVLGGQPIDETLAWAPRLGLEFSFRLDPLAVVMGLLVTGIGALVLVYSAYYFGRGSGDARRSAPLLLAFAGAMLGLVLVDDLIALYVFWELTTICSFLLVGQAGISRESRRAALQALLLTTLGGLAMLLGFVVLGETAGTYRISELLAAPPSGPPVVVAGVLTLVGAFTKSAQIPFHNWLPAAMVAPTPISAYLHAASMVKAGVFLIARLGPIFVGVAAWTVPSVVLGLLTMIVCGWRALREYDLKKLLAYGTVSQLGFLVVLQGAETYVTIVAGLTMLLAHGLFKATLFLVVGIIDHQTGTRDVRELSGLGKRMPVLATIAGLAAASMAGVPPMLGFVGKEAAFEAFTEGGPLDQVVGVGLLVGSVFTVAYSLRLMWGAFATKPGIDATEASSPTWWLTIPALVPALFGLVLGPASPLVDSLVGPYAARFDVDDPTYYLALWHGFNLPLLYSLIALVGGILVHRSTTRLIEARESYPENPDFLNAQRGYERIMALLERTAVAVTGRTQAGSLPTYVGIILLTVLAIPGVALLAGAEIPTDAPLWHHPLQVPLAIAVLVAVVGVVRAQRRLTAVLMVGFIGYGIGGLFIVDGGPDLALAQFLVETLTLVAFVFVLRRLPIRFSQSDTASRVLRGQKMLVAVAGGVFVAAAAMIFSSARQAPPVASQEFIARAEDGAGATNIVNAILVDFRAFDTVGEIAVLSVAATGVASLIIASRFERRREAIRRKPASDDITDPADAVPEPKVTPYEQEVRE